MRGSSALPGSKILVFDRPLQGHFRRGVEVVSRALDGQPRLAALRRAWPGLIAWRGPLVLNTSNSYLKAFLIIALIRHLLGRRTVGIMTRDPRTYRARWAATGLPRTALEFVFSRSRVRVFSIMVPADRTADGWLYDIEWWDLQIAPLPEGMAPPSTVLLLGDVNVSKGLGFFIEVAQAAAARGYTLNFVVVGDAGEFPPTAAAAFQAAGGRILPRIHDDAVFVNHMRHADWIWCCYRPPRDWSSGLFGRALQLGKRTIVRKGSYLEAFQKRYGQGAAIDFGDVESLLRVLTSANEEKASVPIAEFADLSIGRLKEACGLLP